MLLIVGFFPREADECAHEQQPDNQSTGHDACECRGVASGPFQSPFDEVDPACQDRLALEEAAQVVGQSFGVAIALGRVFVKAAQTDGFQIARRFGLQLTRRHRIVRHDLHERFHRRRPLERRLARQAFVEDRTEGVDIRGWTELLARSAGLLRCHVRWCAQDGAALGLTGLAKVLRQTEVGDFRDRLRLVGGGE